MQIDWVRYKSGTPIARFGGVWDRKLREFVGDAKTSRVIECHAQQVTAIEVFDRWMGAHLSGREAVDHDRMREIIEQNLPLDNAGVALPLTELFLSGGRRSGKTFVMGGICASYTVAVPGALVWTVVTSETFHDEPRDVQQQIMCRDWYEYNGWPHFTFYLANGSTHIIRSGHSPPALKRGQATIVAFNEAQQIKERSYINGRGATIDLGGFTICATNPPTDGDVGEWVTEAVAQIEKGERPGAEHVFVDPLDNPHIDIARIMAMRTSMTEHDWETQIRGKFLAHPGAVLYSWSRTDNERQPPDIGDITREFVTAHEGDRARWQHIVSIDVQEHPYIACAVARVFRDPRDPLNSKAGLLWVTDQVALRQGDEEDACAALAKIVDPARTLVIMDASCSWQQMVREEVKQLPRYKGAGSMDIFRRCGFPHVVPPDRRMLGNPAISERIRATQMVVKEHRGENGVTARGLFVDPKKCPEILESIKKWRMKKGRPQRTANAAHFGDTLGYLAWRFFPRRGGVAKMIDEALAEPSADQGSTDEWKTAKQQP